MLGGIPLDGSANQLTNSARYLSSGSIMVGCCVLVMTDTVVGKRLAEYDYVVRSSRLLGLVQLTGVYSTRYAVAKTAALATSWINGNIFISIWQTRLSINMDLIEIPCINFPCFGACKYY
jgi:hypothetical protein